GNSVTTASQKNVLSWLHEENKFHLSTLWKLVRFGFPAISISALLLYIFSVIPSSAFYPLLLLFLAIAFSISKVIMPDYALLNKIVPELETLFQSIKWIESCTAKAELIQTHQESLGARTQKASV